MMKEKLLLLIGIVLFFSFAAAGQPNPKDASKAAEGKKRDANSNNKKELEELGKMSKHLIMISHKIMQAPMKQLTKTKDVREEAEKYFQAWINGDAAAILGYQPPFVAKTIEEANKILGETRKEAPGGAPSKPADGNQASSLEEVKSLLKDMNNKFK